MTIRWSIASHREVKVWLVEQMIAESRQVTELCPYRMHPTCLRCIVPRAAESHVISEKTWNNSSSVTDPFLTDHRYDFLHLLDFFVRFAPQAGCWLLWRHDEVLFALFRLFVTTRRFQLWQRCEVYFKAVREGIVVVKLEGIRSIILLESKFWVVFICHYSRFILL